MQLFWWIIWIFVIVYVRIWIINNAFKNQKFKWQLSFSIFVLSFFMVIFLYFYKDILTFFNLSEYYLLKNNTLKSIWSFVIYCLSFIILLTTSFGNIKKKSTFKFISIAVLLFLWIGVWWSIMWINMLVMYYLVSSYAEEILKFSISQNVFLEKKEVDSCVNVSILDKKNNLKKSDLIFFAIIAWLGFSVIENIFYLVVLYFADWKGFLMSMWRSIFTTLLHIVATWLIAFFVIKKSENQKNNRWKYLLWILCGFGLHGIYNLSLFYNIKIVTIVILIVCYFILSYLLFNSDLIYQKK